jgi:hypothetical protein
MIRATVDTIDTCFACEVLAIRLDDDYVLVRDFEDDYKCWVNPDYVIYH